METILIILKALPAIDSLVKQFIAFYVQQEYAAMKKDDQENIKKAIYEYDQRNLEQSLGSSKAGLPSGVPDAVIVDHLPGVPDKGNG